jgi:chromosome partitioning protein
MPDTKVIAIVSEKGGAGKTIIATSLAVAAEAHGIATAIFDLDPRANSAVWGDSRADQFPAVVPAQVPRLDLLLKKAREQETGLVIIDTPGNDLGTARAAAERADVILIPCQPSPPDLLSIVPTVQMALETRRPAFVILNAAPAVGTEVEEARAAIAKAGVAVAPVVFYRRKAFSSRFHEGLTAWEIDRSGKATEEIRALFLWLAVDVLLLAKSHDEMIANKQTS